MMVLRLAGYVKRFGLGTAYLPTDAKENIVQEEK